VKAKTINAILSKKFDAFVESITDAKVQKMVRENTIITGGAITSMLLKEDVKDFDLYFTNKETALAVAEYYVAKFNEKHDREVKVEETPEGRVKIVVKSAGVAAEDPSMLDSAFEDAAETLNEQDEERTRKQDEAKGKFRPVFMSSNAITLAGKVQIVIRFYGDADTIHSNYDFVHCTNYWTSKDRKLTLQADAMASTLAKELVYQGSKYPLCSVIRTRKFIKRGWTCSAGQYLKMLFQVSQLDLNDIAVLEDQLVGVDSAYFMQIIEHLKAASEENPDFKFDNTYLCELIDQIF